MKVVLEIEISERTSEIQDLIYKLEKSCDLEEIATISALLLNCLNNQFVTKTCKIKKTESKVFVRPNGPLILQGPHEIVDESENVLKSSERSSFCRCGASRSMPNCDGSHNRIGFIG